MKTCTTCKELKSLSEFFNYKASKDGKSYRCKVCDSLARAAYHKKHYEVVRVNLRNAQRKHKYGLGQESFKLLYEQQSGLCAICSTELSDKFSRHHEPNKLVIDHCHQSGKVRGLLCTMCNKALGLFKDNPINLENAIKYLEREKDADIH